MTKMPLGQTRVVSSRATQNMDVPGFAAGCSILTLDGAIPVEYLTPGDRVITRDVGMAILRGVEPIEFTCDMVSIKAGTLGHTRPEHDTLLPAMQKILLRDWRAEALFGRKQVLAPAHKLVDGEFIDDAGCHTVTLFQLTFDAPHILYVDGLEMACEPQEALRNAA
ncbi:Hint domain-containing protein [Rhodobacteraceae bacterium D3-12]|nr:Hint domain-containing protein [Rhodobacteraceae bacterium D3-12]